EMTIAILAISFALLGVAKILNVNSDFKRHAIIKEEAYRLKNELIGYAILNNQLPNSLATITANRYNINYQVDTEGLDRIFKEILTFDAEPTLCIELISRDCDDPNAENYYALFLLTHPDYPDIQEWVTTSYLAGYAVKGWAY
ncbi:MAG: hypothetical protein VSS52_012920, partial [Thiotrichaceae bacterium]|nr:hypothetical protein [Thiotrichaceae bacterium]